ncbi:uncharacterized protein KQ657_003129 [Scheffersomyces spartinae]|uniref:FAD-binding FR-type domain-containing protein n=1 Tax=Scheffersomyces spartinae TaxID=45513 RepID=A0A9P8AFY9_9ASCO|nr:uncharacterized protein KQ657_003129 [Scheffersomyces spartinae]KAG7191453.1 hypothetical protein KQ657_003129 [Scheffersomyces spartinae]
MVLPSVAFWVFDRTIRFTKLIRFGFPLATIKVVGEKEDITLKVTIPKPKNWNHFAGSFIWIQFLAPSSWWQSHPFTCIVERQDGDGDREEVIVLYCKVKEGVTEDLYKRLLTTPAKEGKIRVAVEGPYVDACQNFYNHNVTFIAGGSGIPGLYSEAKSLAQTKQRGLSRIIRLFWIVKNYESVGWFKNELASLEDLGVQVTIFVTRYKKVPCGTKEINAIDRLKATLPFVLFIERRPDLEEIINEDVKSPSVGFVACGHPRMVDEVRALVVQSLDLHPGQRLDFYELLQVWS